MFSFNRDFGQSTGLPIIASLLLVRNGRTAYNTAAVGLCWNPSPNDRVGSMLTMGLDIYCAEAETKILDCWSIFGKTAELGSQKKRPQTQVLREALKSQFTWAPRIVIQSVVSLFAMRGSTVAA